jgi:hypothetical protein
MIYASFTITGGEEVAQVYKTARPELTRRYSRRLRIASFKAVRTVQTKYRGAATTSANATRQGSGILRGSYGTETPKISGDEISVRVGLYKFSAKGAALIYGHVHEEGATIKPKSARMLAIPLPGIRNPSGVSPRPRDFPDAFIVRGKSFAPVLVRRLADGVIQPLFALRSSVTVPARPKGGAINAAVNAEQPELLAGLEADTLTLLGGVGVTGGFNA